MERRLRAKLPGGRFKNVPAVRSRVMSAVRGCGNRTTEIKLRFELVRAGICGWTMHDRDLPGRPDFFFVKERIAIFVDGCFWHGCRKCGHIPRTRSLFWGAKIRGNRQRDRDAEAALRARGIIPLRFWEHQLISGPTTCIQAILEKLGRVSSDGADPRVPQTSRSMYAPQSWPARLRSWHSMHRQNGPIPRQ